MKGLFIKGYNFLPKYCQECPCFTYTTLVASDELLQSCKPMGYRLVRDTIFISDIRSGKVKDWHSTIPPKWCPAEIKEI